jgi:hypothetical protein
MSSDNPDFPRIIIHCRPDAGRMDAWSDFPPLPGESWRRGNDLGGGAMTDETVDHIAAQMKEFIRRLMP